MRVGLRGSQTPRTKPAPEVTHAAGSCDPEGGGQHVCPRHSAACTGLERGVWKELLPAGLNQEVSALTPGRAEGETPLLPA